MMGIAMSTNYAVRINAPTGSSTKTVATAASTATSFSGATRVWLKSTVGTRLRCGGSSVACTAGDIPLTANTDYVLDIQPGATHFSCMRAASTSGTLYWTPVA